MHEVALSYVDRIRDLNKFAVKLHNDRATLKTPDAMINSASSLSVTRVFELVPIVSQLAHVSK